MAPVQVEVGRAGVEGRLRAMQDRPVPWGSGGPPALGSPFPSKEATRPSQDTLCAHSIPFAATLCSAHQPRKRLLTLRDPSRGVLNSPNRGESLSLGCLVRAPADPDCSSARSAISRTC